MAALHAVLSILASLLLLANLAQGWTMERTPAALGAHFLLGMFTTVFVGFVHGMLMSYLLGLGKSQKTAVQEFGLDPDLLKQMRRIKARGFPMATFAPIFLIVAGILGGGVRVGSVSPGVHLAFVCIAVLANLYAFPGQVRVLRENARLMERIEREVEAAQAKNAQSGSST